MITKGTNPAYIAPIEAAASRSLINSRPTLTVGCTVEWGAWGTDSVQPQTAPTIEHCTVTPDEAAAIKRKAKTASIDIGRAEAVKWAMLSGCDTLAKVQECVSGQYRPTQVSIYRAALLEQWAANTPPLSK